MGGAESKPNGWNDTMKTVNEDWYIARYPRVSKEMKAEKLKSAQEHYEQIGTTRGYRPVPLGPRFETDPARYHLDLWTDRPDAKKVLAAKKKSGEVSAEVARQVTQFMTKGFVVLKQAVDETKVDAARDDIDSAYLGRRKDIKFAWSGGPDWDASIVHAPAKALDMHYLSTNVLDVIMTTPVVDLLNIILEGEVLASQSLSFFRGSQQELHQDTLSVTYSQPKFFVSAWTALEDVQKGAGELLYVPGSHKLEPHLFADKFYSVHEALNHDPELNRYAATRAYLDELQARCAAEGLKTQHFLPKKGDVLIAHPLLAHGGATISNEKSRKSVVSHFCPAWVAPHYFEHGKTKVHKFNNKASYSTFAY